jgi:A/G-specific adenine glycosylase
MLQQTQVGTVIPYYEEFLSRFPTVHDLAKAPLEDVLKVWEGLGYYARARNLHRGAKYLIAEWSGRMPDSETDLVRIPGIGRSTAGAILSLAFEKPSPILDGNVKRVLCRLFAIKEDPKKWDVEKQLWSLSQNMTPVRGVHPYTQSIMDLGAMVCTPRAPDCLVCPLNKHCLAYAKGLQHTIPMRASTKPIPHRQSALGIIRKQGRVLIVRRPEKGLLGGLWGFPGFLREGHTSFYETLKKGVKKDLGLEIETGKKLGKVEHTYSHFKITLHVIEGHSSSDKSENRKKVHFKWIYPSQLKKYPLSGADKKVIKML